MLLALSLAGKSLRSSVQCLQLY